MGQRHVGLKITIFIVAELCIAPLSSAQSIVLECSIGGQERYEVVIADPISKSIHIGTRIIQGEVSAERMTWKEDGTVRMIDRSTGAVLHRLPDESYLQIGQCRSSKRKF